MGTVGTAKAISCEGAGKVTPVIEGSRELPRLEGGGGGGMEVPALDEGILILSCEAAGVTEGCREALLPPALGRALAIGLNTALPFSAECLAMKKCY
jgi:hypothetical protein